MRERKQVERTECTTREDRKENDRKDVGGRRVNASGHCQPEDPLVILQLSTKHTHGNKKVNDDWCRGKKQ